MNILVTGATGFVGRALMDELLTAGHSVTAIVRCLSTLSETVKQIEVGDLTNLSVEANDINGDRASQPSLCSGIGELNNELNQTDVLIHTAARVHIMKDKVPNPLQEFRRINTEATLKLARKATTAGVKRFIFLSTIKVNGESTDLRQPFSADDQCSPIDPYAVSKWEAEQGLMQLAKETGMEVVIIRLPLIYGPGVKGNFSSMMRWICKGVPLPLGGLNNQRSLLALDNLNSFIIHCIEQPKAANKLFLLADDEDVSTTQLIIKLANAMGKKPVLLTIPAPLIKFVAALFGRQDIADRLFGSLQVDSSKARELLGWQSVVSMDEQLKRMVK